MPPAASNSPAPMPLQRCHPKRMLLPQNSQASKRAFSRVFMLWRHGRPGLHGSPCSAPSTPQARHHHQGVHAHVLPCPLWPTRVWAHGH
eukprot:364594-Chlamydomonas_euryale.AAC.5